MKGLGSEILVKTGFVINPYGAEISQAQAPAVQSVHCASSYTSDADFFLTSSLSLCLHPHEVEKNRYKWSLVRCWKLRTQFLTFEKGGTAFRGPLQDGERAELANNLLTSPFNEGLSILSWYHFQMDPYRQTVPLKQTGRYVRIGGLLAVPGPTA
jgi:hypothetical protein